MSRCGTSGHTLGGLGVLGWGLDLMILEVFSNLNDSVILLFMNEAQRQVDPGWDGVRGRGSELPCYMADAAPLNVFGGAKGGTTGPVASLSSPHL